MKQLESKIQTACVNWFRMQYPSLGGNLVSVPNGGSRNKLEAIRLKREGVTRGVADLALFIPNKHFHGLFIEMKTPKTETSAKGRQSQHQKTFESNVTKQGYKYTLCYSLEEFILIIDQYLKASL